MPAISLTEIEARILGSLIEKSYTTPDQYPLSINSLTSACNQKSSREPVMDLSEADIARALATLQEKQLVGRRNEPSSRVTKFLHHVENLINGGTAKEIGPICVLLLRGPQTPGEIKTRTDRLCDFESTAEVEGILVELAGRTDGPFVVRLARQSGQKEARYAHLFFGPISESAAPERSPVVSTPTSFSVPAPPPKPPSADRVTLLEKRVAVLESAVLELQHRLNTDKQPTS